MNFLGIIPARYGSTRLEGKPLADICGKPMIQHVYERAKSAMATVYIATDDARIVEAIDGFEGKSVLTSPEHNSGTNRCLEAYDKVRKIEEEEFDAIINIQGDEPMLHIGHLKLLMSCFENPDTEIASLIFKVNTPEDLYNKSEVFVTFDKNYNALYFSRAVIPELKDVDKSEWFGKTDFYKHIGLYAYKPAALELFASLPQSQLETAEGLEQNRWLENGHSIKLALTDKESFPVDTQEDLEKIRTIMCE
jgi:3-deoxy-manno-octulosonate cytidylyltransferase (CMP-KDO synthetase)